MRTDLRTVFRPLNPTYALICALLSIAVRIVNANFAEIKTNR